MEFSDYRQLLGGRIQNIRLSRNLTQEQVAELLGMDRVSVGYIEQGRRAPKISTLFLMSQIYDVEMQDFFPSRQNDRTPSSADSAARPEVNR